MNNLKKLIAMVLVVAICCAISVGVTVAYLTDEDEEHNVFTVGDIDIDLKEEVAVNGDPDSDKVTKVGVEGDAEHGAKYENIMPGDKLQKKVTIENVGPNAAYVAVSVTLRNENNDFALLLNKAIDEKYGDDAAQAWYDEVFQGWGLNHSKDLDGDEVDDAGMRLTITGDDMPEHVLHVDSVKTIDEYSQVYSGNWFDNESDVIPFNSLYTQDMGTYALKYVYYLDLEPGESSVLFEGLNVPYEFDRDQLAMFEDLHIDIEAKAIQADGFGASAQAAFSALHYPGEKINHVDTPDAMIEALENGEDVLLTEDVKIDPAGMSNAYGKTGINVKNGQTIDGGGNTLDIKGAGGTWDSGINTTGGIIRNIKITGSFRGIFVNHNSTHSEPVILENVTVDGTVYTISCDQGTNQGLTATNCTFNGWTSYAATLGDAKFIDCSFGEGNGYAYMRPYCTTSFVGCDFEAGFSVDPRAAVTFKDCTVGGVALTAANLDTLVVDNIANATVIE